MVDTRADAARGKAGCFTLLGVPALVLFLLCTTVGFGMIFAPSHPGDRSAGGFALAFGAVAFGLPAAWLLLSARGLRASADRRARLVGLANSRARIPLDELASQLGLSPAVARELLVDCIATGQVRGRLDINEGVFLSASVETGVREVVRTCSSCGAPSSVVAGPGQAARCPFCGGALA